MRKLAFILSQCLTIEKYCVLDFLIGIYLEKYYFRAINLKKKYHFQATHLEKYHGIF